jgi:hypothetical protein
MSAAVTPRLTTGWEPDLPDADSLSLRWLRHWSDQCAAFATAAGGTVVGDDRYLLADYGRPASYFNAAVLLAPHPDPRDLHALLDEIEARSARGTGEVYLWSLWPTPDLRPRGWTLEGHPPLLVRPPTAIVPLPPDPGGEEPIRVRSVAELAEWERVAVEGYPMTDLQPLHAGALAGPALLDDPRVRFWATFSTGQMVAISAQFVSRGVASFALGVTLPSARRGRHWMRHARMRLHTEPERWQVGVFSDYSRAGAEQLGFVPVTRHTLWQRAR